MTDEVKEEPFTLSMEIEGRHYQFVCNKDSPLHEVYNVISRMKEWCEEKIKELEKKPEEFAENAQVQEQE